VTGTGETPPLLLSDEEKTVAVYLLIAIAIGIIAAGASLALLYWALPQAGQPADAGKLGTALPVLFLTWFVILFAIFGRWSGRVSSEVSIDLGAAPYDVWEAFALRDDYPGWKKIYTGIERLDEPGEVYRLHYADDSDCTRCSLPRDPDRSRWSSRVEILEARRPSLYRQRSFPKGLSARASEMEDLLDSEDLTMRLDPLAGGATRLTCRSTVVRPKMWMAFLTMLGRPLKQHVRSLKAHVEGTPDETLFGIAAKRMEAARNAPQRCSCPEPS
jgi:hypothetical protein